MITLFNRKELTITFSMEQQVKTRDLLAAHKIDYKMKVRSSMGNSRARMGTLGINMAAAFEYIFYVHKDDLKMAQAILSGHYTR